MSLDDLVKEVVSNPWAFGMIPEVAPTHRVEDVTSITWYRQGQFQIQLFAMPPNCIVPEHTHTNVDSYEVMMGGRMLLSKHGRWVVLSLTAWRWTTMVRRWATNISRE